MLSDMRGREGEMTENRQVPWREKPGKTQESHSDRQHEVCCGAGKGTIWEVEAAGSQRG